MSDNTVIDGSFVVKCPFCSGNVAEGYAHCPHCGASLAQTVQPAATPPAYSVPPPPIAMPAEKKKITPTSVIVIGILLIISGATSLLSTTCILFVPASIEIMEMSFIPLWLQFVITYLGVIVTIVSGIAILKGYNWGRWLSRDFSAPSDGCAGCIASPMKLYSISKPAGPHRSRRFSCSARQRINISLQRSPLNDGQ